MNQKGVSLILLLIPAALIFLGGAFIIGGKNSGNYQQPGSQGENHSNPSQNSKVFLKQVGDSPGLGAGVNKPFYSQDGLYLTHSWPSEGNFSAEETEILLFNESESNVEVKSFNLEYQVEGKTYPHKSGTWEKFPNRVSWERTEYLNISPNYYKGQPLDLARGEKGKLHWHINFGPTPLDGKQTIKVKLTLLKDGQTINIDEEFNRDSGTVFSKENH